MAEASSSGIDGWHSTGARTAGSSITQVRLNVATASSTAGSAPSRPNSEGIHVVKPRAGDVAAHARASRARGDRARPLALAQSVRLNRERRLIESSRMTIAQVAQCVGREDATALRRLMRKSAGATPSQFRAAWSA